MKEIIDLDAKLVAHFGDALPETPVDISRDEMSDVVATLPEALRAEIESLQRALNAVVPEPFDYFVFLAGDEEASFSIHFDQMPADNDFDPAQPIVDQVRALDWDEQRSKAVEQHSRMDEIVYLLDRLAGPLPSAKKWQREFREDIKDFVREKRRDPGKIHALFFEEEEGLMENEFADGDAFREALPAAIMCGGELISVVAGGKPLPVERLDALKAEAQRKARENVQKEIAEEDAPVQEIEAEVVSESSGDAGGEKPSVGGESV